MANSTLSQPLIAKLLSLGECHGTEFVWSQYSTNLHLNDEDIPELIQIAIDPDLNHLSIEHLEAFAPIHARRALGQLKATAAIEPLMELFHKLEDNEWVGEELPKIYGMIGAEAILPLQHYLGNNAYQLFPRLSALNSLEEIARQNPEQKTKVAAVLVQQLQKCLDYPPELNAFIITSLINLQAVQSGLVIKHAFENHCVADDIISSWELVRSKLGINNDDELLSWENLEEFYQIAEIPPESSIAEEIPESSISEEIAIAPTSESSISEEIAIAPTSESSIAEEIPESSIDEEIAIAPTSESSIAEEIPESSIDEEIAIAPTFESSISEETPVTTPEEITATTQEITESSTPEETPFTTLEETTATTPEIIELSTSEETTATTPEIIELSTSEETPAITSEISELSTEETPVTTSEETPTTTSEIIESSTPEETPAITSEISESSTSEEMETTQLETIEAQEKEAEKSKIELSPTQTTNHHQHTTKSVEEEITSSKIDQQPETETTKVNKTAKGFGVTNQKPKTPKKKKK